MNRRAARNLLALYVVAFGLTGQVVFSSSTQAGAGAQSLLPFAQKGTGLILGRVVDGTTGEPIAGARVICSIGPPWLVTDSDGRFVFFDLPAGSYRFSVTKPGYMTGGEFGQRWAGATTPMILPGVPSARGQSVLLGPDERRNDVTIRLWKQGAITGRVTDDRGEPLVGLTVQAWSEQFHAGRVVLNSALPEMGQSDDRGIYRIIGVPPGRYVVVVAQPRVTTPADVPNLPRSSAPEHGPELVDMALMYRFFKQPAAGSATAVRAGDWLQWLAPQTAAFHSGGNVENLGFRTTFFAAASTAEDASRIMVPPGEDAAGVDFQLRREPLYRVSGRVTGPSGPSPNIAMRLVEAADGASIMPTARPGTAVSDASGRFMFLGVPRGNYIVQVVEFPRTGGTEGLQPSFTSILMGLTDFSADFSLTAQTLWASIPLTVDGDVSDVQVSLRSGGRVMGSLQFVGGTARPAPAAIAKIPVLIDRVDGGLPTMRASREVEVEPSGDFHSIALPPGRYFVRVAQPPSGWMLQAVEMNGRDVSVDPLELGDDSIRGLTVRFTDRPSVVSGSVRTKDGVPDAAASVAVFPLESRRWIDYGLQPREITSVRVDEKGRYEIRGLPHGDYWIVAIDDAVMTAWNSQELFIALSRVAQRLQIADGDVRAIDLVTKMVAR